MLKECIGILLIITSLFDAWKYIWNAKAILKVRTSKGHSRKFILVALGNDIVKLTYGIVILDLFIIISSILALGTMSYMFYVQYLTYPYRHRNRPNFQRPNLYLYIINSLTPNNLRKHL
jgi:hypothetical protein